MESSEVHEAVLGIIRQVLNQPALEIADAHAAKDIPKYDSLSHIEILVSCQRSFGVKLTALEAGQIANFGDLKALVSRKLAARA